MRRILIDVDKKEIKEIIPELESRKYILPSFQRQYVWDEDDIKDLINSIINNYPIGTIILWKPSNSFLTEIDRAAPVLMRNNPVKVGTGKDLICDARASSSADRSGSRSRDWKSIQWQRPPGCSLAAPWPAGPQ